MKSEPLVSIICTAYNQQKYITKMLDSIVFQKAEFEYEVIVHDDASTDSTIEIIEEYSKKHSCIVPVFENENQSSKSIKTIPRLITMARGKYLAFCEGDDYFCDFFKLQKQVDILEKEEDVVACVHAAYKISEDGKRDLGTRKPYVEKDYLDTSDIVKCIGRLYSLNSLMCRKSALTDLDGLYLECRVGDIPIALHLSRKGRIRYLSEIMSVYRIGSDGSWNIRMRNDKKKKLDYQLNVIETLEKFDALENEKYHTEVKERIAAYEFEIAKVNLNLRELRSKKYIQYYKELSIKKKIKIYYDYFMDMMRV